MMTTTEDATLNGVDLGRLTQTVEAIQSDGDLAQFRFRSHTTWVDGARSRTRIQGFWGAGSEDGSRHGPFELAGDEPEVLLGTNQAPNAVEAVLHALASCLAVGMAYHAAAQGIAIRSLEFDLEGRLDLHGFLGLVPQARPGYEHVEVTYHIDSDASASAIEELCREVERTSPVLDILRNPVDVRVVRAG
jgi:uncharacterized OsmC-like protein